MTVIAIGNLIGGMGVIAAWRGVQDNRRAREQDRQQQNCDEQRRRQFEMSIHPYERIRVLLDGVSSACTEAEHAVLNASQMVQFKVADAARDLRQVACWVPGLRDELEAAAAAALALSLTGLSTVDTRDAVTEAANQGARQYAAILEARQSMEIVRAAMARDWSGHLVSVAPASASARRLLK